MLTFDLEICEFNSHCAISRKRLKGDSWFYKKVCEEILRISNCAPASAETTGDMNEHLGDMNAHLGDMNEHLGNMETVESQV